jgi:collagenase. Unknown type peptidase. MEROPS family U32
MMTRNDIEIMAPVGSYESLMGAIQGGANSVYFGIEQLNMRAKSSNNFSTEDLKQIVSIANEHNIKTYLTVNTVIYDKELTLMRQVIDAAKTYGVSAIIAADQAAIGYARSIGVEVHISTQVNISNIETLRFYSLFADVVVLARELNMDQVKNIHQTIVSEQIKGPSAA